MAERIQAHKLLDPAVAIICGCSKKLFDYSEASFDRLRLALAVLRQMIMECTLPEAQQYFAGWTIPEIWHEALRYWDLKRSRSSCGCELCQETSRKATAYEDLHWFRDEAMQKEFMSKFDAATKPNNTGPSCFEVNQASPATLGTYSKPEHVFMWSDSQQKWSVNLNGGRKWRELYVQPRREELKAWCSRNPNFTLDSEPHDLFNALLEDDVPYAEWCWQHSTRSERCWSDSSANYCARSEL